MVQGLVVGGLICLRSSRGRGWFLGKGGEAVRLDRLGL